MTATAAVSDCATFDASALSRDNRRWAADAAVKIRKRLRLVVKDLLEAAKLIRVGHKRLGKLWREWLQYSVGVSVQTGYRLYRLGEAFAGVAPQQLANFTPTALYELSAPNVPQSLREYAVQQATSGEKLTAAAVRVLLAGYRDAAQPSRAEVAAVMKCREPEPRAEPVNADDVQAADNWRLLCDMLESGQTIHFTPVTDEDTPTVYSGMAWGTGPRRAHTAETVEGVLLALADVDRKKKCGRCNYPKRLDLFSRLGSSPDGRNRYCKKCERERVRLHDRQRQAAVVSAHAVAE